MNTYIPLNTLCAKLEEGRVYLKKFLHYSLIGLCLSFVVSVFVTHPSVAKAAGASLLFSPSQGEYLVGSTFEVSVVVNSNDQAINAVEAFITFPADKLQVVSPTIGKSFIEIWVAGPSFSNSEGKISFQGGLPHPGIKTSAGIVSTISFRAKAAGKATLKFEDSSRILANDGLGSDLLTSKGLGTIDIKVAPPSGPVVSSTSHEDQSRWYQNRSVTLVWDAPGSSEFSYVFDNNPSTIPDEKSETSETHTTVNAESDGVWFFHIRGKNQYWGGTTHFTARIDTTAPAVFKPDLDHAVFQQNTGEVVSFSTTDATSGIDHYEVRVISKDDDARTTFFLEEKSPYKLPALPQGEYSIIVRAFDRAGNSTDGTTGFRIVGSAVAVATQQFPIYPLIALGFGALVLLALLFWLRSHRHKKAASRLTQDLADVKESIEQKQHELKQLLQSQNTSTATWHDISNPNKPDSPAPPSSPPYP